MAEGNGAIYNNFKEEVMEGVFDLSSGGDTLRLTLHTGYTPDVDAHTTWADVSGTEYGTADGYIAGGEILANQDVTQDDANNRGVFDTDNPVWASLGPLTPATPSHAILKISATGELICYWELGETATNGGNYTVQFDASGIILLT